jgi:uncharacterized coiled-coil protein SlyX
MMEPREVETVLRKIDARTARVEERITRVEERTTSIEQMLPTLATKQDVAARTRRHFEAVADEMRSQIGLIAEGDGATRVYVDERFDTTRATLESYDKRIMKLEAKSMKPGDTPKRRSSRS